LANVLSFYHYFTSLVQGTALNVAEILFIGVGQQLDVLITISQLKLHLRLHSEVQFLACCASEEDMVKDIDLE
jgi:hypothetical protein